MTDHMVTGHFVQNHKLIIVSKETIVQPCWYVVFKLCHMPAEYGGSMEDNSAICHPYAPLGLQNAQGVHGSVVYKKLLKWTVASVFVQYTSKALLINNFVVNMDYSNFNRQVIMITGTV